MGFYGCVVLIVCCSPLSRTPSHPHTLITHITSHRYREMAEDAVDRVIQESENDDKNDGKRSNRLVPTVSAKSTTLNIGLKGNIGYSSHLYYKLQQRYGIPKDVAENLSKYGAEADEIMNIEVDGRKGRRLVSGFPYLQAEVVRRGWGCTHLSCG